MAAVRAGSSLRAVARTFRVGLATVQLWVGRAGQSALDGVEWSDRSHRPVRLTRTEGEFEDLVIEVRTSLREQSVLGEYGAAAIRRELDARGVTPRRSLSTIGRILERRGALDAHRRVRHRPPPPGWYLPPVAARTVELDSFDVIERIRLLGGQDLDVLTGVSLHGGLIGIWPEIGLTAVKTVAQLATHWRAVGLPGYVQFDNDTRFIGGNRYPDSIGPVIRLCLALGVVPVFVPPRETGFQAAVEALNGRWERKVWARFWMPTLEETRARSDAYVAESHRRHAVRIDGAPPRTPCSAEEPDLRRAPSGRLAFIRRTSDAGAISVLGRSYPVDRQWVHRLVRAELDLDLRRLQCFALRRADPAAQPLLNEIEYVPPARWFR